MFLVGLYWHHQRKLVFNTSHCYSLLVYSLPVSSQWKHLTFGYIFQLHYVFLEIFSLCFTSLLYVSLKISWNLDNYPLTLAKERIRSQSHEDQVTKFQFSSVASLLMSAWGKSVLSHNLFSSVTKKVRPGQWLTWKPWGNVWDL